MQIRTDAAKLKSKVKGDHGARRHRMDHWHGTYIQIHKRRAEGSVVARIQLISCEWQQIWGAHVAGLKRFQNAI